ncbi:DUF6578 domain-containing protein [Streptomyces sp. NPDC094468]|uniref:DUF6578 domain-containing protein n=1 Tax=Streptomyces sp. NPDC094468 TaxID=3366066 RepID=UPI0037F74826
MTIWVDDWQIQCCGDSFTPGDVVSWRLLEVDSEDYADVIGTDRAAAIDFHEEHHGYEDHASTLLQVLTVTEVHCRYEVPPEGTTRVYQPVPGTTVLVPVEKAEGWAETQPDVQFVGYLVTARRISDAPEGASTDAQ